MQIVIPAYKPDEKLLKLIDDLHNTADYGIIVVNDGSGSDFDSVFDAIPEYVTVLKHDINRGKGRAMKTAFEYICKNMPHEIGAIIADADGQHLPKDIVNVANHLIANPEHLVLGSRKFTGKVPFKSRWGNAITRFVFALASGVKVYDTQTGLRGIPIRHMPEFIALKGDRYEYEMNMLLRAAELGIVMEEITIDTVYINENESSHFHPIRDSFKIYAVIFKFIFSSLFSTVIDYVLFVVLSLATTPLLEPNTSNLVSVVGARIVSSLCNFFINQKAVFKGCKNSRSAVFKYYATVLLVLALNYGLLTLMTNVFMWNKFIAQVIAMILTYPVSYYVQRMFVFKTKSKTE